MGISYEDEGWVEAVLCSMASVAPESPVLRRNTLWLSKATGRRGRLLWSSGGRVKLSFSESNPDACVEMAEISLLNNYDEIK